MRYLNKITFINSAAIRYAEINLDGNIHLIGTQGVGKSTLLRAILFFYNADSLKLGIPSGKKSFGEHYFFFANSFIIYEIKKETGVYSVLAYKSLGRVCFRFIDGAYERDHYIDNTGKAYDNWEKIRAVLDKQGIHSSRKIDRYEEYRDILYGNNEGKKEFRKYALLESKQYQNIPRTIQNVFLSSKLEAEFIKETIIKSLDEEDITINLDIYNHHLHDFENKLADIQRFRMPSKMKQAEKVSELYIEFIKLENDKKQYAGEITWALERNNNNEPSLKQELIKKEKENEEILKMIKNVEEGFERIKEGIKNKIYSLDKSLESIEEKKIYYQKINIEDIILRVSKKRELEEQRLGYSNEIETLTTQFKETTKKYDYLISELKNQLASYVNLKKEEIIKADSFFLEQKENLIKEYEKIILDIRKENELIAMESRINTSSKLEILNKCKVKEGENKYKRFFEEEIGALKEKIENLKTSSIRLNIEKTSIPLQINAFQQQWELEETRNKEETERKRGKLEENIQLRTDEISLIQSKIDNGKDSFYGWLNENLVGWENTIGKVIDEQVLFTEGLNPRLTSDKSNFYGIDLRLEEVNKTVKTLADYDKEKSNKEQDIKFLKQNVEQLYQDLNNDLDKIRKKFQPKIKEIKDRSLEIDYEIESNLNKKTEADVDLSDLILKATAKKENITLEILVEIQNAENELKIAQTEEQNILKSTSASIKEQELQRQGKINQADEIKKSTKVKISNEIEANKEEYKNRLAEIEAQRNKELSDKGVDTKRLGAINENILLINKELEYIDQEGRDHVTIYYKDKSELFDRKEEYEREKNAEQTRLEKEVRKYDEQKEMLSKKMITLNESMRELKSSIQIIIDDTSAFEEFKSNACFLNIGHHFSSLREENSTLLTVIQLIDKIKTKYYSGITKLNELKEAINFFLSNFSNQNIFGFKVDLKMEIEFLQFATDLNDFIAQDRLTEFERRVNERYAEIIKLVGKETTELTSKEGEINKIIKDINSDFEKKNFVGVIQKIELKMDESSNAIVQILKTIKKFNDENISELGAANLFSGIDQEANNKKAIDLLKQLVKEITKSKKESVSLSDSFELRFRVVENLNDTGWVENLANVGSEGTDILVKAMVNIMLLNVFKEGASKKFKDFRLHCMMDEIGKLHPANVRGILKFANDRNIVLINGSPTENDALAFRHIYKLEKDAQSITKVKRIMTQYSNV